MHPRSQASRAVLAAVEPTISAAGTSATDVAAGLFSVVDALDSHASLRRALTDPSRDGAAKKALVADVFTGLDKRSAEVVHTAVATRFSDERDLADTLESAGVEAVLIAAESAKALDTVEQELFALQRLLDSERDLRVALDERSGSSATRVELLNTVIGAHVGDHTRVLVQRLTEAPRSGRLSSAIHGLITAAASRRDRAVAHVTAARALTAAQSTRLQKILTKAYGRDIQVNVAIEPKVLGGIRVQVGHEVVDGTVLSRLDEARQKIGG